MSKAKWTTHKHLSDASSPWRSSVVPQGRAPSAPSVHNEFLTHDTSAKLANSGRIGRKNAPNLTDARSDVKRTRTSELFTCSAGSDGGSKERLNAFDSVRPDFRVAPTAISLWS